MIKKIVLFLVFAGALFAQGLPLDPLVWYWFDTVHTRIVMQLYTAYEPGATDQTSVAFMITVENKAASEVLLNASFILQDGSVVNVRQLISLDPAKQFTRYSVVLGPVSQAGQVKLAALSVSRRIPQDTETVR